MNHPDLKLLTPYEVSQLLGVKESTLSAWRVRGGGPKHVKVGRKVMYRLAHIDEWLAERARGQ